MTSSEALRRTPFFAKYKDHGAKTVPFAGWEMPIQYTGIIEEHMAVRNSAGLFDVSHMGDLIVRGSGAKDFLRKVLTNNIDLAVPGKGVYSHMLREDGTIIDDTIVYNLNGSCFLLVPNASTKDTVLSWLRGMLNEDTEIIDISQRIACLAVQGPKAADIAQRITQDNVKDMKRFGAMTASVDAGTSCGFLTDILGPDERNGTICVFARTGYTGEDGFEILVEEKGAGVLWDRLMSAGAGELMPAGLGCRDTLRLEKGMLLSGTDFDGSQTTLQTGPRWVVKFDHEFIGRGALEAQKEREYDVLVGLATDNRNIPRHGHPILRNGEKIGIVTSGTMSPVLRKGIAMGYVPLSLAAEGTELEIDIRGRAAKATVTKLPFV